MTRIVGVHGIWNYRYYREYGHDGAAEAIGRDWTTWLRGGLPRGTPLELIVGYYAHHLHRGIPQGTDKDPTRLEPGAQDLLISWVEQLQPSPQIALGPRTARARQAIEWLTRHYGHIASMAGVVFCREVYTYIAKAHSPRREAARETVATTIAEQRPRIIIAHSLGSVVAYEALWAHPELSVDLLLTLGSPLGMHHVIFDRLKPPPAKGRGARPPGATRWVNLADVGDIFAVPRDLPQRFDGIDYHCGDLTIADWDFHTVKNYLSCPDTARVILPELHIF